MRNLSNISYVRQVMERHNVSFSKGLGQNFLINPSVCPKMAEECMGEDGVLEIGPGIGVLTWELSQRAKKVVSVELDKRLLPVLQETLSPCNNVKIIQGDVLKLDLKSLIEEEFGDMQVSLCANLPYYITSPVVMRLLEERLPLKAITVMVQKEAAQRLCALPGTRACGAVSAAVRYYCRPEILFQVSRGSFTPAPNVDSAVIRLHVLEEPSVQAKDEAAFFALIRAAFSQRRKTVLNSVSSGLGISKDKLGEAFIESGVSPMARAEALSMEELCALSNAIVEGGHKNEVVFR